MHLLHLNYILYILNTLKVWGVKLVVTYQTSWLEFTGVKTTSTLICSDICFLMEQIWQRSEMQGSRQSAV